MNESDLSGKESQDEMSALHISNNLTNVTETGKKRLREEPSFDENLDQDPKKLCISNDITSMNGIDEHMSDNIKYISTNIIKDNVQSMVEKNENEIIKKSNVGLNETKYSEATYTNNVAVKEKIDTNILTTIKVKEHTVEESIITAGTNETVKEEVEGEENEEIKSKKKYRKSQIEDAEVVEGLELSVECASDKESSASSDNQFEKSKKPMPKTIIIKAKPNDSELDVSSSEAEKSDSQEPSDILAKDTIKKEKRKGRTSFSKIKDTDSEENNDVSDEDYSPKTKRKFKKTVSNKRSARSPTEQKKGRNKAKINKKSVRKEDEEDENSNITEDRNSDVSDVESEETKSEDESDDADSSNNRNRKKQSSKADSNKKIQLLKKYIRITGIHIKSYNDLWADCKSNSAKISCLKALLEKNGVNGRPTIEKCKKAKERNERLKDIAELNTSNIISEGRITRAQRNKDSIKECSKSPETPTKRIAYKRVLTLVDSDSE